MCGASVVGRGTGKGKGKGKGEEENDMEIEEEEDDAEEGDGSDSDDQEEGGDEEAMQDNVTALAASGAGGLLVPGSDDFIQAG